MILIYPLYLSLAMATVAAQHETIVNNYLTNTITNGASINVNVSVVLLAQTDSLSLVLFKKENLPLLSIRIRSRII